MLVTVDKTIFVLISSWIINYIIIIICINVLTFIKARKYFCMKLCFLFTKPMITKLNTEFTIMNSKYDKYLIYLKRTLIYYHYMLI